jgi:transposase-like protein
MDEGRIIEEGQNLSEELAKERQRRESQRWRCPVEVRARIVACSADGESHQRIADRLGVLQRTLSRWIRRARQAKGSVRPVAIVPSAVRA